MLNYKIKIGLAPMRRDVTPRPGIFNWEKAEERGHAIVDYIEKNFVSENVSFTDLKGINPVDVMYCDADAEKVIERFKEEKVDAVLIINCNFGNEEIAAQVAKGVGKPVCIWAPMDDSFLPDGTRFQMLSPVIRGKKGRHEKVFEKAREDGFVRARVDGEVYDLSEPPELEKNKKHDIEIVVARLVIKPEISRRLTDSAETALSRCTERNTCPRAGRTAVTAETAAT